MVCFMDEAFIRKKLEEAYSHAKEFIGSSNIDVDIDYFIENRRLVWIDDDSSPKMITICTDTACLAIIYDGDGAEISYTTQFTVSASRYNDKREHRREITL